MRYAFALAFDNYVLANSEIWSDIVRLPYGCFELPPKI